MYREDVDSIALQNNGFPNMNLRIQLVSTCDIITSSCVPHDHQQRIEDWGYADHFFPDLNGRSQFTYPNSMREAGKMQNLTGYLMNENSLCNTSFQCSKTNWIKCKSTYIIALLSCTNKMLLISTTLIIFIL